MSGLIPLDQLTPQSRRRGILALSIGAFFAWAGFFMIIPLVAVHYVDNLGWAAGTVGIVLAVRQFTQQSLTTLFGVLSDRVGPKILICSGMLLRGAGFAALARAESFWPVLAAVVLSALGGGMFESPKAAALAAFSTPENRQRLFASIGVISGLGVTLGTQLGAFLIQIDFAVVGYASASAYVVIFAAMFLLLPNVAVSSGPVGSVVGMKLAFADRTFMLYLLILSGFWFCWTQFSISVTLAATSITGTETAVAWIYAVNSVVTVGLGYVLPRYLERWLSPLGLLIAGVSTTAVGLGLIAFADGFPVLLAAAGVFAIGSVLARPGEQTVTANLASPTARGTYFGVAALSLALGGGLGNFVGGTLFDLGRSLERPELPWVAFFVVGMASAIALWLHRATLGQVREEPPVTPAQASILETEQASTRVDTPLPHRREIPRSQSE
ncbi:MAG: MFS transporter [Chloroflexia bacterium]|nr:MFS transporter [Chloroflexia bacterium]MDQ3614861.1 MFS transporter [Chloroflexota bacterium]